MASSEETDKQLASPSTDIDSSQIPSNTDSTNAENTKEQTSEKEDILMNSEHLSDQENSYGILDELSGHDAEFDTSSRKSFFAQKPGYGLEHSLLWRTLAEFFGTFFLMFVLLSGTLFGFMNRQSGGVFEAVLTFSVYAVAALIFASISGAHFNPAISLVSALAGRLKWVDMICYMIAQVLGGIAGALLTIPAVSMILPLLNNSQSAAAGAAGVKPSLIWSQLANTYFLGGDGTGQTPQSTLGLVILFELVATIGVTAVALCTMKPSGADKPSYIYAVPLAYATGTFITYTTSYSSMNPARSTGAAIVASFYGVDTPARSLWVFWIIPFLASAIVGLVFIVIHLASAVQDRKRAAVQLVEEDNIINTALDEDNEIKREDMAEEENTHSSASTDRSLEHSKENFESNKQQDEEDTAKGSSSESMPAQADDQSSTPHLTFGSSATSISAEVKEDNSEKLDSTTQSEKDNSHK